MGYFKFVINLVRCIIVGIFDDGIVFFFYVEWGVGKLIILLFFESEIKN